jgi:carbon-monoxide dehydrogenase medium subunit
MPELKALYQPGTLAEAQSLLEEHGERARPLAGGTSLVLSKSAKVEVLVDLSRVGLDRIEDGPGPGELRIGAMVTCSALRRFLAARPPTALSDAVGSLGSRILQNHVTVGGNCVMVYAWSDLPVVMLALESTFEIQRRAAARRSLAADSFFSGHPTRSLAEGELVVAVNVPGPRSGQGSAHLKFCRNAADQALASASARIELDQGVVRQARVVVGAVRGLPQLLSETSDSLLGKEPDAQNLSMAADLAGREAKVSSDFKASAEYRTQLVRTIVEDTLSLALSRAGGNQ